MYSYAYCSGVVITQFQKRPHANALHFDALQELTPAPVYPLVVGVSAIALFISMPRYPRLL